jgi:hypothetical protein
MLATIDVAKSECFKPEDRENFFETVRREVGVGKINSMIFESLRSWVIETADIVRNEDPDNFTPVELFGSCIVFGLSGETAHGLRRQPPEHSRMMRQSHYMLPILKRRASS